MLPCARGSLRVASAALLLLVVSLAQARAAACDVRINEFCAGPGRDWDGSGVFSARDDEWVELVNTSTMAMDLSLYLVSDADSTIRWSGSDFLNPGEHRVIFGGDAVTWQRDHGRTIAGFSLANAGDAVRLWRIDGAETTLVESYAYKPHEAATDRTVGRLPDETGSQWILFDALNNYTGTLEPRGSGCPPTPHQPNQCSTETPTNAATWGRIKAVYR